MAREQRKVNAEALVEFLRTEGIDFKNSANSWLLSCPLCQKDKWAIRKSDGYSRCYHCQQEHQGYCDYTLAQATGKDRKELSRLFYGFSFTTAVTEERGESRWADHWAELEVNDVEVVEVQSWPPEILPSPDHHELDSPAGARGLAYLEGRGVSLELAKEYGIKYDPSQERVIFPIVVEGVLRGWQGRLVKPAEYTDRQGRVRSLPKALTEGEVGGKVLMFQDRLKGSTHGIITEGPMDAIKLDLCGGGNTATMGKSVTSDQLDIYARHFGLRKIYLGLDDDAAEDVERIVRELAWYKDVKLFRLMPAPGRDDLGEGSLEENLEQFRSAQPIKLGQTFTYLKDHQFFY